MTEEKRLWVNYLVGARRALSAAAGTSSLCGHARPFNRRAVESLRIVIPYCLHPISDQDDTLIWLNRDYKPLGTLVAHADYEKFSTVHADPRDPAIAKLLQEPISRGVFTKDGFAYWLFDDLTAPSRGKQHAAALVAKLDRILSCTPYGEYSFSGSAQPATQLEGGK